MSKIILDPEELALWTPEQAAVLDELGEEEVIRRAGKLDKYYAHDTLVTLGYDLTLTPAQMIAFAHLAQVFGDDALISDNAIKRLKPLGERMRTACRLELDKRAKEKH